MARPSTISLSRKLLFSAIITVLLTVFAELSLRLVLGPPPPGVMVLGALKRWDTAFSVADGQVSKNYEVADTGPSPSFPARSSAQRVAVIGESSVHGGSKLSLEMEFPGLLQQQLGVPVVNLAAPGLDSFNLVQIIEESAPYDFAALVVYTGHNDIGNTWFESRYGSVSAGLAMHARALLDKIYLFGALRRALSPPEGTEYTNNDPHPISMAQRQEAVRLYKINLERIVWAAHSRHMAVILAPPACRLDWRPLSDFCDDDGVCARATWSKAVELASTDPVESVRLMSLARDLDGKPLRAPSQIQEAVRQVAAEQHTWLVDLPETLPKAAELPVLDAALFSDFIHLSAQGHQVFAKQLEPALREALAAQRQ